jgi:isopentenyl diphosphate isomerase/L-lactate dehydrogenase-like FMN-dependent dehydrogenase
LQEHKNEDLCNVDLSGADLANADLLGAKLNRAYLTLANQAGAHVLVLTVDVPVRAMRAREVISGVTTPFRPDLKMLWQIAMAPAGSPP